MAESGYEFVMPGLVDSIPVVFLFILFPIWLTIIVFKYTRFSQVKKVLLIPACVVAPFIISLVWPLILKYSGFIRTTGSDEIPYSYFAVELFGRFSEYVWTSLTGVLVFLLFKSIRNSRS